MRQHSYGRTILGLATAAVLTVFSSAHAGYELIATRTPGATFDAITVSVVETPPLRGDGLFALDWTVTTARFVGQPAFKMHYRVADTAPLNGIPDTVDITNAADDPAFSFVRIGSAANTTIITDASATTPTGTKVEPNPWLEGVTSCRIVALANVPAPDAFPGSLTLARFVVDHGSGLTITGMMAGNAGPSASVQLLVNPLPEPTVAIAGLASVAMVGRRFRRQM
jgi:hypothetical protein